MDATPFAEDTAIATAADQVGMVVSRRAVIEVDQKALHETYLRTTPDWNLIRKHLEAGIDVPGASRVCDPAQACGGAEPAGRDAGGFAERGNNTGVLTMENVTDPVRDAESVMEQLKGLRASLQAERTRCLERASTIDALLGDMGDIAKPKVGRPRKRKEDKAPNTQT